MLYVTNKCRLLAPLDTSVRQLSNWLVLLLLLPLSVRTVHVHQLAFNTVHISFSLAHTHTHMLVRRRLVGGWQSVR